MKFQFWAVFLTFNGTFLSLLAVGILGMPRRVISYAAYLQPLNVIASVFAFGLGASMALFLGILIWKAVIKRTQAIANPWESLGVEWQVPTPVPVFNFDRCRPAGRCRTTTTPASRRPDLGTSHPRWAEHPHE